jgi:hypothetical protein
LRSASNGSSPSSAPSRRRSGDQPSAIEVALRKGSARGMTENEREALLNGDVTKSGDRIADSLLGAARDGMFRGKVESKVLNPDGSGKGRGF